MALHVGSGGGSGSGAPTTAQYVTLATDATLTAERVLTAGVGISLTDGGAGSTLTIAATGTAATAWHNTGDSFGALEKLGTTDNFALPIYTNNAERFRISATGELYYGVTATVAGLENFFTNKWRLSGSTTGQSTGGNLLFLVDNSNGSSSSTATIMAANELGCGAALTACSDTYSVADSGLIAGDVGLIYNTIRDIDPTNIATCGLVFHAGISKFKWVTTNDAGTSNLVRMYMSRNGAMVLGTSTPESLLPHIGDELLQLYGGDLYMYNGSISLNAGNITATLGSISAGNDLVAGDDVTAGGDVTATGNVSGSVLHAGGSVLVNTSSEFDAGSCLVYVKKDFAGNTYEVISNKSTAGNARPQYVCEAAGPTYMELGICHSTYSGDVGIEAGMTFLRGDGAGGVGILTSGSHPFKVKTNGNNTRYQIDGDGKMAWFGATTVAQQAAVADASGGATQDAEARTAINALLARLRNYSLIAT